MMRLLRALASLYSPRYPAVLVYMLQNTEYHALPYLAWYWQTNNFFEVMYRRSLDRTKAARLLLLALRLGIGLQILCGAVILAAWWQGHLPANSWAFGLAVLVSYPVLWAHLLVVPLVLGRVLVVQPKERRMVRISRHTFAKMPAIKIAIAGSYGKTSMKELLLTVLGAGKKVAATPANKNVAISHARFAKRLQGDEEIILLEYGEGKPGDVARFAKTTQPQLAIITGVAAAHLDRYKTVEAAARDIFSLANAVPHEGLFVNGESQAAASFIQSDFTVYDRHGLLGWKVRDVTIDVQGTSFALQKGQQELKIASGLLGRHQIGPLALAAVLAFELGLTKEQVEAGVAATKPFEHRMQPYQLNGAWIIDDTYNGNIEGIRAGTQLLHELPANRKIYVTPGLVDQGKESAAIHQQMGELIAAAKPDIVVLMRHSVTPDIERGLQRGGFAGELLVEPDPLNFYQNLQTFVAAGDLVLLQNDWPDNYL